MPRPDDLLDQLRAAPAGLGLAELLAAHPDLPRRTAQRWLAGQVAAGQVRTSGDARARRYHVVSVIEPAGLPPAGESAAAAAMPLSPDSRDILAYVAQPLAARRPVGYQREFLDAYIPDVTCYLSLPLRRQLRRMGDTGQSRLPAGTYGRAILSRLLIDLSWASSHLEGNTYSRLDTRALLEHGQVARGKALLETQMLLNHKAAIELLVDNPETVGFNHFTLCNLHSALAENLLPNPADEGRLRRHAVEIGHSVYRPPGVPALIEERLGLLLDKAGRISDPFEQSFFVMVHLPYLQPFADANKRTSRLLANLPLLRANLCPLTFLGVPEVLYSQAVLGVYEMTRVELLRDLYVFAYERSTQEYLALKQDVAEPDPLRLSYRDTLGHCVREAVRHPAADTLATVAQCVAAAVPPADREAVQALVLEELRRLHEGVLARYGLRPAEFAAWQAAQENISLR